MNTHSCTYSCKCFHDWSNSRKDIIIIACPLSPIPVQLSISFELDKNLPASLVEPHLDMANDYNASASQLTTTTLVLLIRVEWQSVANPGWKDAHPKTSGHNNSHASKANEESKTRIPRKQKLWANPSEERPASLCLVVRKLPIPLSVSKPR